MDNKITINVEELLKVDDNSITDYKTIRQIGLISCTRNDISVDDHKKLNRKVKREFLYLGLYPYVMNSIELDENDLGI